MNKSILECDYFSVPGSEFLTEVIYKENGVNLRFECSGFDGSLKVFMHQIDAADYSYLEAGMDGWDCSNYNSRLQPLKNNNFEKFFRHCVIFPGCEEDACNIPVSSGDIEGCFSISAYYLSPDSAFHYVVALNVGTYHYLVFIAEYKKIEGMLLFNPDNPSSEGDGPATSEVYGFLTEMVGRLRINKDIVKKETIEIEKNIEREDKMQENRKKQHMANYSTAEKQAADPFNARYYPKLFAELQEELAKYPELSKETLDGIYTNASAAIAYITEDYDNYSEKGNTRFFGLPDLPPELEWPKVSHEWRGTDEDDSEEGGAGWLYKFIAQINCADLQGMQDYFPKNGILYFFVETVWDVNQFVRHKVFYYDGDSSDLQSAKDLDIKPDDVFDVWAERDVEEGEPGYRMRIVPFVSVLTHYKSSERNPDKMYPPAVFSDINGLLPSINLGLRNKSEVHSKMEWDYPHSRDIQTTNADTGGIGAYNGCPYQAAADLLGGKPEDYLMLLHTQNYGADSEEVFFVISKEKLRQKDFSKTYCGMSWFWNSDG